MLACSTQAGESNINKEASKVASTVIDQMLTKCGEYYIRTDENGGVYEFKNAKFKAVPNYTEADKLNGFEWKGWIGMDCLAFRGGSTQTGKWNPWSLCNGASMVNVEMAKKNGQWVIFLTSRLTNHPMEVASPHPFPVEQYTNKLRVSCQQLPKDE